MKKFFQNRIAAFLLINLLAFPACVTDGSSVKINEGLSRDDLARYSDTFERFREELWETASYVPNAETLGDFKYGELRVEGGRLRAETRKGYLSQAGVGSKFVLRGDFDVQIDCEVEFLKDVESYQQVTLGLLDRTKELQYDKIDAFMVLLSGGERTGLFVGSQEKGNWHRLFGTPLESFRGSFRFTRSGKKLTISRKEQGEGEWKKMASMRRNTNDQIFFIRVRNFYPEMTGIKAKQIFSAEFDNFRINAAEKILEEEI